MQTWRLMGNDQLAVRHGNGSFIKKNMNSCQKVAASTVLPNTASLRFKLGERHIAYQHRASSALYPESLKIAYFTEIGPVIS